MMSLALSGGSVSLVIIGAPLTLTMARSNAMYTLAWKATESSSWSSFFRMMVAVPSKSHRNLSLLFLFDVSRAFGLLILKPEPGQFLLFTLLLLHVIGSVINYHWMAIVLM
jgi:hypothetical protein